MLFLFLFEKSSTNCKWYARSNVNCHIYTARAFHQSLLQLQTLSFRLNVSFRFICVNVSGVFFPSQRHKIRFPFHFHCFVSAIPFTNTESRSSNSICIDQIMPIPIVCEIYISGQLFMNPVYICAQRRFVIVCLRLNGNVCVYIRNSQTTQMQIQMHFEMRRKKNSVGNRTRKERGNRNRVMASRRL